MGARGNSNWVDPEKRLLLLLFFISLLVTCNFQNFEYKLSSQVLQVICILSSKHRFSANPDLMEIFAVTNISTKSVLHCITKTRNESDLIFVLHKTRLKFSTDLCEMKCHGCFFVTIFLKPSTLRISNRDVALVVKYCHRLNLLWTLLCCWIVLI